MYKIALINLALTISVWAMATIFENHLVSGNKFTHIKIDNCKEKERCEHYYVYEGKKHSLSGCGYTNKCIGTDVAALSMIEDKCWFILEIGSNSYVCNKNECLPFQYACVSDLVTGEDRFDHIDWLNLKEARTPDK